MKSTGTAQFRRCHLPILRSLYSDEFHRSKALAAADSINASSSPGTRAASNRDTGMDHIEEPHVSDKTWDLIQQFLHQRNEYHPCKQRQNYWVQLNEESKSRLDDLLSIATGNMQEKIQLLSPQKRKSTPSRTPLLTLIKKRPNTPTLSLTPLTSNRTETHQQTMYNHEISSWTFINRMIKKRAESCTSSCDSFRAQPFLQELRSECDLRCKVLNSNLQRMTSQKAADHCEAVSSLTKEKDSNRKRDATTLLEPFGKRRKTDGNTIADHTTPSQKSAFAKAPNSSSSELYFFRDFITGDGHAYSSEVSRVKTPNVWTIDDLIIEAQIKLCLWSSLFSSVKEIVDEP